MLFFILTKNILVHTFIFLLIFNVLITYYRIYQKIKFFLFIIKNRKIIIKKIKYFFLIFKKLFLNLKKNILPFKKDTFSLNYNLLIKELNIFLINTKNDIILPLIIFFFLLIDDNIILLENNTNNTLKENLADTPDNESENEENEKKNSDKLKENLVLILFCVFLGLFIYFYFFSDADNNTESKPSDTNNNLENNNYAFFTSSDFCKKNDISPEEFYRNTTGDYVTPYTNKRVISFLTHNAEGFNNGPYEGLTDKFSDGWIDLTKSSFVTFAGRYGSIAAKNNYSRSAVSKIYELKTIQIENLTMFPNYYGGQFLAQKQLEYLKNHNYIQYLLKFGDPGSKGFIKDYNLGGKYFRIGKTSHFEYFGPELAKYIMEKVRKAAIRNLETKKAKKK